MGHVLHNLWTPIRDTAETAATLAGNYYLPGSSLLTDRFASKGSQGQLNSPLGRIANIGSGLAGAGVGSATTGIPAASEVGGGWTNAANSVGGVFGNPTLGTNIVDSIGNATNSVTSGLGSALRGAGSAVGLTGDSSSGSSGPGFFSRLFGSGSGDGLTAGDNQFLSNAKLASQGFSPADINFMGKAGASTIGNLASGGGASAYASGGGSSYLPLGAALLGGANSLNANDKAQKDLLDAQRNAIGQLDPYLASGRAANTRLSDLLGTSDNTGASGYGSLSKPFTPQDLQNDPGYQFQLKMGNQALDRKASATGGYFSGAALKGAEDYGQGLADTTFRDAFARDQAAKAQQYGMFAGQSGAGQGAAGAAGNIYNDIGNTRAGAGISSSNILNSTLSSLLTGSGAKRPYNIGGQIYYK